MKVHSCPVQDVPDKIFTQLHALNHGSIGMMRSILVRLYLNDTPQLYDGVVAYVEDNGTITGWGLVFTVEDDFGVVQRLQYLYVEASQRGKGIGTAIAQFGAESNPGLKGHAQYSTCFARAGITQANENYMHSF